MDYVFEYENCVVKSIHFSLNAGTFFPFGPKISLNILAITRKILKQIDEKYRFDLIDISVNNPFINFDHDTGFYYIKMTRKLNDFLMDIDFINDQIIPILLKEYMLYFLVEAFVPLHMQCDRDIIDLEMYLNDGINFSAKQNDNLINIIDTKNRDKSGFLINNFYRIEVIAKHIFPINILNFMRKIQFVKILRQTNLDKNKFIKYIYYNRNIKLKNEDQFIQFILQFDKAETDDDFIELCYYFEQDFFNKKIMILDALNNDNAQIYFDDEISKIDKN